MTAKCKQVAGTFLVAWPTLAVILPCLSPVARDWPLPLRSLASATSMAITMNLVNVPVVRRLLVR